MIGESLTRCVGLFCDATNTPASIVIGLTTYGIARILVTWNFITWSIT